MHVLLHACQFMMFVNKYKISDEKQITITFLLISSRWLTFYVSANNIFWVLFVAYIYINVHQPSAEMKLNFSVIFIEYTRSCHGNIQ